MTNLTITVQVCDMCGEHARQIHDNEEGCPETWTVEAIQIMQCVKCGILACWSCAGDGWCCETHAESLTGQRTLFGEVTND